MMPASSGTPCGVLDTEAKPKIFYSFNYRISYFQISEIRLQRNRFTAFRDRAWLDTRNQFSVIRFSDYQNYLSDFSNRNHDDQIRAFSILNIQFSVFRVTILRFSHLELYLPVSAFRIVIIRFQFSEIQFQYQILWLFSFQLFYKFYQISIIKNSLPIFSCYISLTIFRLLYQIFSFTNDFWEDSFRNQELLV